MARYTDDSKEKVRDAVDFADLVGRYTELRRAGGARLEGLCPFHDERTPSFGIDPVQKLFHCFGCGTGGDLYKFVELKEGLDFKGSMEWLADRYGVELQVADEAPGEAERRRERGRLLELLERTATFYARHLWESSEAEGAREYLRSRGLSEQTLREFRVGYAPSRWDTVLLASRRAGFSNREVAAAGLAKGGGERGRMHDHFRRRITFPLCDRRGQVLGFGGRALGPDQKPKYVNSPEGPLYQKRKQLFAADVARMPATKSGSVILAEGYMDVLAMHQAGLRNTVGLMGTALTEEQVAELARMASVVLLCLDADAAGQEAMIKAARVAAGRKLELRVVPLPPGKDPADIALESGAAAITELVEASVPFVRFQVERELGRADLASAEGKDRAIAALQPVFADMPPSAVREELLRLVADRTDLAPSLVSSWLSGAARPAAFPPPAPARPAGAPRSAEGQGAGPAGPPAGERARTIVSPAVRAERAFLAQVLALGAAAGPALDALDLDRLLSEPLHRRAAAHLREHPDGGLADLAADDDALRGLLAELSLRADRAPASRAGLEAEALKLELAALDREIAAARSAGVGGVASLTARRADLKHRVDRAIGSALDE